MSEPRPGRYFQPPPATPGQVREWDRIAIEEYGIPGLILMENAGEACVRELLEVGTSDSPRLEPPFHVVCGPGNNGGDGFVIARHLHNRGLEVHLHWALDRLPPAEGEGEALVNRRICEAMGLGIEPPGGDLPRLEGGTVIDAIFGTGLTREVKGRARAWIEALGSCGLPVVAIDIPSGLDATSGEIHGVAVRAGLTLTFVAEKIGFRRGAGPDHTGEVRVLGISIPRKVLVDPAGKNEEETGRPPEGSDYGPRDVPSR